MSAEEKMVHEYLADLCPTEMMHALQGLAGIDYPVDDAKELEERLREKKRKPGLLSLLRPGDFPLASPRNAFEKLGARTEPTDLPEPAGGEPPLPSPEDFDERVEPGIPILRRYLEIFSPFCAEQAAAEYSAWSDGTIRTEYAAFRAGREKGEACERLMSALRRWHLRRIVPGIPPRLRFPPP